jgi:glycosyltransferase involved in cell wall biosynthesis
MNILVLEPYYGGSHKSFLDQLSLNLPYNFHFLTLPARKWKWRMRLAAPYFAEQLVKMNKFDLVLCSTFVDVAALRGCGPDWLSHVPVLTYFHENQFAYPVQINDERDFHFALTNYTTALASDRLAFNSSYNYETFLAGCHDILELAADMPMPDLDKIKHKSVILYPGLDFSTIDHSPVLPENKTPLIVWNHRWEHDKNPKLFFEKLFELEKEGVEFEVAILGQSFQRRPKIFAQAREKLRSRIRHWGFVESRQEYIYWLRQGNVVVSTATHEFYGIAVIEAVRAGCTPLLPDNLSYPELFPAEFLYQKDQFAERLKQLLISGRFLSRRQCRELTEPFSWKNLQGSYSAWFCRGQ